MSNFPFQQVKLIQSAFGFISSSLGEKLAFEKKFPDLEEAHQNNLERDYHRKVITGNFRKSNFACNLY